MLKIKQLMSVFLMLAAAKGFAAPQPGRYFDRAIFVIFENTNFADAVQQPYFKELASRGALFTNFFALAHPSQGNYIALTSGDLNGIRDDRPKTIDVSNVADLLEAKGLTWKVYAESYPGNCFTGKSSGTYVRKHNPMISYAKIQKNPARCANIVDASEFDRDAVAGRLPNYIFYVPDMNNDGHDTGVSFADTWYRQRFTPILANAQLMQRTILISTFDESGFSSQNQIYTSVVGPAVKPGVYADQLTIPSLLKLVEDNWSLGNLGRLDVSAIAIPNIWR